MKRVVFTIGFMGGLGVVAAAAVAVSAAAVGATLICRFSPEARRFVQRVSEDLGDTVAELKARVQGSTSPE